MKRHVAYAACGLTLTAVSLAALFYSRADATAPAVAKEDKAAPKMASSRIVHVTVYPDSALVTREVEVPAGEGVMELVVSPLPEATQTSSLYAEAPEGLRVLTTRFRSRAVREDTREEVRKLEEEIRKLQATARRIQSDVEQLAAGMLFVGSLEKFSAASTQHATEKGKLDSDSTIALSKYLMETRGDKAKQSFALKEQLLENSEAMEFATRKLREITSGSNKVERDAVLVLDKVNGAAGKVRLNYLVTSATWRPQYKFRAGKTSKDPIGVEYLASVLQQTGEDWDRVQVTLSTAQPMLNATPPDLLALAVAVAPRGTATSGVTLSGLQSGLGLGGMPAGGGGMPVAGPGGYGNATVPGGRLSIANPGEGKGNAKELQDAARSLRAQAQMANNVKREKDANELSNYAAVLDQVCELVVMTDARRGEAAARPAKNEGPSVTYHLANRLSVPSRTEEQVIEVTRLDMTPEYYYKAVPVLTPHVYRQASIVNNSKSVLLPGEATMYNGSDFVGRMQLPLVAVGETFTVGLGTEPQLQVSRQMMTRDRAMQGGNQILKFDYRILVSSYKAEKVKV
ncbi:MAG: mucoidy inhibitor MuiA family protein, partial [Gemmataceae bacterium]